MGEMGYAYIILVGNMKGRDNAEDLSVDGKIILKWILGKVGGKVRTGCIWLRIRTCEHGNEALGSIKGGKFLD
jgi:hypothetical protein